MKTKRIVLITGTSSGFGLLTAKTLAKKGFIVYASMREVGGKNKVKVQALQTWAEQQDVDVRIVELDVTSDESVQSAGALILTQTGGIDVIINNAGIYGAGIQESFGVDDYKTFFDVNVFGGVRVNNVFLPTLRRQGSGLIIHISSVLGRLVIPFAGVYDATKFAAEALNENLAYELKPLGIDVTIVQPGPFPTEIIQKRYQPANPTVSAAYGKSKEYMEHFFQRFNQMMTDPNVPNKNQDVADAILQLIEMPAGHRPLRVVVDKMMAGATEAVNQVAHAVQSELLKNLGFQELARA